MPLISPLVLLKLYKEGLEQLAPSRAHTPKLNELLAQLPSLDPALVGDAAADAQAMMRSAVRQLKDARPNTRQSERFQTLYTIPSAVGEAPDAPIGAAMNFSPRRYNDKELYVDTLGSQTPLGGLSMMSSLRENYPGLGITLHSRTDPNTIDFYKRLGMRPGRSDSSLPYFELPASKPLVREAYGLPNMAHGGLVQ